METAIVVFTRDLRLYDNPALNLACSRARQVAPLFVVDPAIAGPPNRARFLAQSLAALRQDLRARRADLVIRHGDPATEVIRLARDLNAGAVFIADDVSRYAMRRRRALEREGRRHRLDLLFTPGLTVVPPGELQPAGGGHYRIFTPYWRAWRVARWRPLYPVPDIIRMPAVQDTGRIPAQRVWGHGSSPGLTPGGEQAARHRLARWRHARSAGHPCHRDDLSGQTSRLSAYLRFGCLSPLELAVGLRDQPGGEEFCRQLAWRDFFYQVTAAFPDIATMDYRPRAARHPTMDSGALEAWYAGRTGIPIVDAGMRQLAAEGFLPNRARMITASFLTRNLGIDWRHGYRHFGTLLADGDVACNAGNWQWVAGTGNNTRPRRTMNPLRQARRFDPTGAYVRSYVPELVGLDPALIHTPWRLDTARLGQLGYPAPIVEPETCTWPGP